MAGGVIGCLGIASLYFTNSSRQAIFPYSVSMGLVTGLVHTPSISMIPIYFSKKRSIANGFALAGPSLGQFVLSPLFVYLVETYSAHGAFLLFGGLLLNVTVFGALFRPMEFYTKRRDKALMKDVMVTELKTSNSNHGKENRENESDKSKDIVSRAPLLAGGVAERDINATHEQVSIEEVKNSGFNLNTSELQNHGDTQKMIDSETQSKEGTFGLSLFKEPLFILFLFATGFANANYQSLALCFPSQLQQNGFSPALISYFLSAIGLSELFGRALCGVVLDLPFVKKHISLTKFYCFCILTNGVATCLFPFITSYPLLLVYATIVGAVGGQLIALMSLILIEFIGIKRLANGIGYTLMIILLLQTQTAISMSAVFELTGTYHLFFTIYGSLGILGGIIIGFTPCVRRCSERQRKKTTGKTVT